MQSTTVVEVKGEVEVVKASEIPAYQWFTGRVGVYQNLFFKAWSGEIISPAVKISWNKDLEMPVYNYRPIDAVTITF